MNPPQRISSETAHQMGSLQDCNRSALQLVINFSKPTRRHSRATGARDTTKLYYTPLCIQPKAQFLACRRARFRRRNFFLRHFQRWLPVFFQAREPRFMVNEPPTCLPYMRASSMLVAFSNPNDHLNLYTGYSNTSAWTFRPCLRKTSFKDSSSVSSLAWSSEWPQRACGTC